MSADLITCPAPLDMLRRGSPVRQLWFSLLVDKVADGVVFFADDRGRPVDSDVASCLHMDLTDATGRAHAAWWVLDCPGAIFFRSPERASRWTVSGWSEPLRGDYRSPRRIESFTPSIVGPLAKLDPDDDTRLPDGSRRVDALALKAVVEHLIAERGER